ncbi:hypothetical protein BGZ57DRAFT_849753 [Hyaloscypha finlandica]|nr:hypothetical protein BGZ57DRAFT_849753 [Hyaloscypha finlandica]
MIVQVTGAYSEVVVKPGTVIPVGIPKARGVLIVIIEIALLYLNERTFDVATEVRIAEERELKEMREAKAKAKELISSRRIAFDTGGREYERGDNKRANSRGASSKGELDDRAHHK